MQLLIMGEVLSPTDVIQARAQDEISYMNSILLVLLMVPISEIKICDVVPIFCIKMANRRTLKAFSLKNNIKNFMFSALGKLNLFKSDSGESPCHNDCATFKSQ